MSEIDPVDRVKLNTWYTAMMLLDHYRSLAREPMYQRGLRWFASAYDREVRATKLAAIAACEKRLFDRWQAALGPRWRDWLIQND
jgi:hypothetical protein